MSLFTRASILILALAMPAAAHAQSALPQGSGADGARAPLVVFPRWNAQEFVAGTGPFTFGLNRPLDGDDGELAVVVDGTDLSAFLEVTGASATLRPVGAGARLASGPRELRIYLSSATGWRELGRFPVNVLRPGGFVRAGALPALNVNSNGQLLERATEGQPPSQRPRFQDVDGNGGLQLQLDRRSWGLETQWNVRGVGRREQALRFFEKQDHAPLVDLSDYVARLRMPGGRTALSIGHVSLGSQRHLVNGFAGRGIVTTETRGPVTLALGAASGSTIVGWDNLLGLGEPRHRMQSAALGVEMIPSRAGALRLDVSLFNGSVLPVGGFTRAAIQDAEQSTGQGAQLSASTPTQRMRLTAGFSRSRFGLSRDDQLRRDTTLVPVQRDTRMARFGEAGLVLLQNARMGRIPLTLAASARHERVDPLYRSVAAPVQADREDNGGEVTLNAGALSARAAHAASHDNLANVPSVLRTNQRQTTSGGSLPLGALLGAHGRSPMWPTLAVNWSRTHALASSAPTNGDFRPVDLPDQVSLNTDATAQWSFSRWRLNYRWNESRQDNRQPQRELADFTTSVNAVSLGISAARWLDLSLDGSLESQESLEQKSGSRLSRIGTQTNWRLPFGGSIGGTLSAVRSQDHPRTGRSNSIDARLEVQQPFNLGPSGTGGQRGRIFVRYARLSSATLRFALPGELDQRTASARWTVATGLSYRLF
jgi:hypothetical protein